MNRTQKLAILASAGLRHKMSICLQWLGFETAPRGLKRSQVIQNKTKVDCLASFGCVLEPVFMTQKRADAIILDFVLTFAAVLPPIFWI